jgi:hypothetical protein
LREPVDLEPDDSAVQAPELLDVLPAARHEPEHSAQDVQHSALPVWPEVLLSQPGELLPADATSLLHF